MEKNLKKKILKYKKYVVELQCYWKKCVWKAIEAIKLVSDQLELNSVPSNFTTSFPQYRKGLFYFLDIFPRYFS